MFFLKSLHYSSTFSKKFVCYSVYRLLVNNVFHHLIMIILTSLFEFTLPSVMFWTFSGYTKLWVEAFLHTNFKGDFNVLHCHLLQMYVTADNHVIIQQWSFKCFCSFSLIGFQKLNHALKANNFLNLFQYVIKTSRYGNRDKSTLVSSIK